MAVFAAGYAVSNLAHAENIRHIRRKERGEYGVLNS
jgi:hypothetical protein